VAEKINNKIEIAKEEIIDQVTGRWLYTFSFSFLL
jgi:hypothetical protein